VGVRVCKSYLYVLVFVGMTDFSGDTIFYMAGSYSAAAFLFCYVHILFFDLPSWIVSFDECKHYTKNSMMRLINYVFLIFPLTEIHQGSFVLATTHYCNKESSGSRLS
jgi:hypothetical protein